MVTFSNHHNTVQGAKLFPHNLQTLLCGEHYTLITDGFDLNHHGIVHRGYLLPLDLKLLQTTGQTAWRRDLCPCFSGKIGACGGPGTFSYPMVAIASTVVLCVGTVMTSRGLRVFTDQRQSYHARYQPLSIIRGRRELHVECHAPM